MSKVKAGLFGVTVTLFALLSQVDAIAQETSKKIAILLECPGQDTVGELLCFRLREEVRKSALFALAAKPPEAFVMVRVHTVDASTPPAGNASAVSVVMTLAKGDSFLHGEVLYVGRNAVDTAATGIIAGIDAYLEKLFKEAAKARRPNGD